jgi:hypothetical protein
MKPLFLPFFTLLFHEASVFGKVGEECLAQGRFVHDGYG